MSRKARCISHLISAGWEVYIPIHDSSQIIAFPPGQTKMSDAKSILITGISTDQNRAPILKSNLIFSLYDLILCSDETTSTVWLLPSDLFIDLTAIRLGRKYEEYVIPEPTSLDYKAQRDKRLSMRADLQTAAEAAVSKLVLDVSQEPQQKPDGSS